MKKRRSGIQIMGGLIGLVKPLAGIMVLAVTLGVLGYLCAIFLTILAGHALLDILASQQVSGTLLICLVVIAVLRGVLHYGEQYCNHFIAFKLLAIVRHRVFAALRKLCPAKLSGKDKGNLISIITSDIELLEVFYAHTISPIAIAALISLIMTVYIGRQSRLAGALALAAYVVIGVLIPLTIGGRGGEDGLRYRDAFGSLNSFVLESLYGVNETIQYGGGDKRLQEISERSAALAGTQKKLNRLEGQQRSVTNLAVLVFSFGMLFLTLHQYQSGQISFDAMLIATISMMGSFGPVIALSGLANNLNQTLASGERVLALLEEQPVVEEQKEGVDVMHIIENASCEDDAAGAADRPDGVSGTAAAGVSLPAAAARSIDFAYRDKPVLEQFTAEIPRGRVFGIHGPSGCGKSTFLRLLMRFWDVDGGKLMISGTDIREINTESLRWSESCVTQETDIFHDTIAANIAVGKPGASEEEIRDAAKKASLDTFIMTLPDGYDTVVGEQGSTLSGGERQRIGIARAFLHDAPLLLLDEPTSNLDSLNEGIILKALDQEKAERTVVLVTHRASTLGIADTVLEMPQQA
ncbi:MAG: ABC transporter ATP-binding protein [Eubacterium sp.]|nr:ABC transporter ATP-binding protein [Eubacterium sp.]